MSNRIRNRRVRPHHWLIRLIGVIVPRRLRSDWRQEWEAELRHRERLLAEWDRLDWQNKLDLLRRSASGFWDALWLQSERWEDEMIQDLRYGVRMLLKHPGFTCVAVITLALGIGANTTIFSVVDALLLKPLPARNAAQLVAFSSRRSDRPLETDQWGWWPYTWFEQFRELTQVFDAVAITGHAERFNLTAGAAGGGVDDGPVRVGLVSGNYFATLGVSAQLGRAFTPDDDRAPGGSPVAVLSQGYWERMFGRAPDVIGRAFRLESTTFTIVGVAPTGFRGDLIEQPTDLWVPVSMHAQVVPERPDLLTNQTGQALGRIVARLKPGVSLTQAQAAAQVVYNRIWSDLAKPTPQTVRRQLALLPAARGDSEQRATFGRPLLILLCVVGLVLLIACANVASMLLARATARQREIATRLALGATRLRIIRQLLTESILLAALGGLVGALVAFWGTPLLLRILASGLDPIYLSVSTDARTLSVTAAVTLLVGILFGLAPALGSARLSLIPALKDSSATLKGGADSFGLGRALVVCQVALTFLLVIGAGLFVRTLQNLKSQDLGFTREHLLLIWTSYPQVAFGYDGSAKARLYEAVQERVGALPGVRSISLARRGLLHGYEASPSSVTVEGATRQPEAKAVWEVVAPNFAETVGLTVSRGRDLSPQDVEGSARVALVNESFARNFLGNEDPLGRHFSADIRRRREDYEIVGVVRDARFGALREPNLNLVYLPYRQNLNKLDGMCLIARTAGDPALLAAAIRQELRSIDPRLPVTAVDSIEEQMDRLLVRERLIALLLSSFGALALLLAGIGLYGTLSYSVARRTREIGIRLALGATPARVRRLILRDSLLLVGIGLLIGLPAALVATRLIASLLFGVRATDPATFAFAALVMLTIAVVAGYLPARRATKVDPMATLRHE